MKKKTLCISIFVYQNENQVTTIFWFIKYPFVKGKSNDQNTHKPTTCRIWEWRGWNVLPAVLISTSLNTCVISLGLLFVPGWPTQPRWLTCNKWLKNDMPSCSSLWPGWWPAWGEHDRLLRHHMLLRSLLVELISCEIKTSVIQSTKQHKARVNSRISCFAKKRRLAAKARAGTPWRLAT